MLQMLQPYGPVVVCRPRYRKGLSLSCERARACGRERVPDIVDSMCAVGSCYLSTWASRGVLACDSDPA
jgi:hypothetical protein